MEFLNRASDHRGLLLWARLGIAHCYTQIVYSGGPIVTAGILDEPV